MVGGVAVAPMIGALENTVLFLRCTFSFWFVRLVYWLESMVREESHNNRVGHLVYQQCHKQCRLINRFHMVSRGWIQMAKVLYNHCQHLKPVKRLNERLTWHLFHLLLFDYRHSCFHISPLLCLSGSVCHYIKRSGSAADGYNHQTSLWIVKNELIHAVKAGFSGCVLTLVGPCPSLSLLDMNQCCCTPEQLLWRLQVGKSTTSQIILCINFQLRKIYCKIH